MDRKKSIIIKLPLRRLSQWSETVTQPGEAWKPHVGPGPNWFSLLLLLLLCFVNCEAEQDPTELLVCSVWTESQLGSDSRSLGFLEASAAAEWALCLCDPPNPPSPSTLPNWRVTLWMAGSRLHGAWCSMWWEKLLVGDSETVEICFLVWFLFQRRFIHTVFSCLSVLCKCFISVRPHQQCL